SPPRAVRRRRRPAGPAQPLRRRHGRVQEAVDDRPELVDVAVTPHPTAAWVWRRLINATPWGRIPAHFVHDRDAVCRCAFAATAAAVGIGSVLPPVRAPRANAIANASSRTSAPRKGRTPRARTDALRRTNSAPRERLPVCIESLSAR